MFSKACEYGIKASIFIAGASSTGRMVSLTDISDNIDSPAQFTAKILQNLVRKKIVVSQKGPNGGFSIPPAKAKQLSLLHIVEAIDGDQLFTGCALGFEKCNH
jgi:Rrf2 family iron-sulfur cluster assembly transcriptional regulator